MTIPLTITELTTIAYIYGFENPPKYKQFLKSEIAEACALIEGATYDFDLGEMTGLEMENWGGELRIYQYKHRTAQVETIAEKLHEAAWQWTSDCNETILVNQEMFR